MLLHGNFLACKRAEALSAAHHGLGCGFGAAVRAALPHFPHHPPPLAPQEAMQALQLPKAVFGPAADEMLLRCAERALRHTSLQGPASKLLSDR